MGQRHNGCGSGLWWVYGGWGMVGLRHCGCGLGHGGSMMGGAW